MKVKGNTYIQRIHQVDAVEGNKVSIKFNSYVDESLFVDISYGAHTVSDIELHDNKVTTINKKIVQLVGRLLEHDDKMFTKLMQQELLTKSIKAYNRAVACKGVATHDYTHTDCHALVMVGNYPNEVKYDN